MLANWCNCFPLVWRPHLIISSLSSCPGPLLSNSTAFQGKPFRWWQGLCFWFCNWYTWFSFLPIHFSFFLFKPQKTYKWVFESSYIWTAENDMKIRLIIGVIAHDWSNCEMKAISRWEWEWGPNQTWMFLGFNVTTVLSYEHKWDDQSYLHYSPQFKYMNLLAFFTFYGYITNLQSGQLPVGLIAQLVQHCTGFAEVMGSNPVQAWVFVRLSFHGQCTRLRSERSGFEPWPGTLCCVLGQDTLLSQCLCPPRCINGYRRI